MQFDWFLSVLEQNRLENHDIYHLKAASWVALEISTLRTSTAALAALLSPKSFNIARWTYLGFPTLE